MVSYTLTGEIFTRETFANFANFGQIRESLSSEIQFMLIAHHIDAQFVIRESLSTRNVSNRSFSKVYPVPCFQYFRIF